MPDAVQTGLKTPFYHTAFAVFLLALAVRLAFAWGGLMNPSEDRFSRPDTESYLAPAASLLLTGEYRGTDGTLTAHRTPGLPVLFAAMMPFGEKTVLSLMLILIGSLAVFPVYAACRRFAAPRECAWAAALFALNPTAIGAAPLLLSDTLFVLFAAFTLYFFVEYAANEKHDPFVLGCAVLFAGIGTLIRPVNVLWIVPAVMAVFLVPGVTVRRKLVCSAGALMLFCGIVTPWIVRNHAIGAGWRLDASSAITMEFNASALESNLTGKSGDDIRARYAEERRAEFEKYPWLYETADARLSYTEKKMSGIVLAHPVRYAVLSLRPYSYLPDVPTLLENLGVTETGRGTFDVLNREGLIPAVKHYFEGRAGALAATIPLILCSAVLYLAAASGWVLTLIRKQWWLAFLLVGFGLYYTVMTGPVTMPRYQLPVLPVLCLFAAVAFQKITGSQGEK